MRVKQSAVVLGVVVGLAAGPLFAEQNLFYINGAFPGGSQDYLQKVYSKQAGKIDVLAPQSFNITVDGRVQGDVSKVVKNFALQHHIKIIPLAVNMHFRSSAQTHRFLQNQTAQARAIKSLLAKVKDNHFAGLQVDFEGVRSQDRQRFTRFYQKLATTFKQNDLSISIALPALTDISVTHGPFDVKAITKVSNFVSIMVYDQHWATSAPGPVASAKYVNANIKTALKYIPDDKLSLGIPTYGYSWKVGSRSYGHSVSYAGANDVVERYGQSLKWDNAAEVPYAKFYRGGIEHAVYAENAKSFTTKVDLGKKYDLRGISVWSLGTEDPKIWQTL